MEYTKADARNPRMGLNNKICKEPKYWCRLYQLWLSEKDVEQKECRHKLSFDMMCTHECGNLEERDFDEWLRKLRKNRK